MMTENTLHLIFVPTRYHYGGVWKPSDHVSQEMALMHFSGGSVVIAYNRLDEIIYTAGLHGWKVTTEGDPNHSTP
jgi:hypothetical protein